ncbi:Hypothetical protein FKW44_003715 [Caligus rogercresseyi]|uniref:Uncharacterized protein n=1 Tax=Caligus rogercresseyi TaxID=217165 RepID=A0A7T8KM16_CALRO|nr:Hypothetical protein FKW44_003715 [Caligus rogercresseyi]
MGGAGGPVPPPGNFLWPSSKWERCVLLGTSSPTTTSSSSSSSSSYWPGSWSAECHHRLQDKMPLLAAAANIMSNLMSAPPLLHRQANC